MAPTDFSYLHAAYGGKQSGSVHEEPAKGRNAHGGGSEIYMAMIEADSIYFLFSVL